MLYLYKTVLDEYDHGNQQHSPFPKLHIKLLEQFEGSRTFTNFIELLAPKYRTEQPCMGINGWKSSVLGIHGAKNIANRVL